MRLQRIAKRMFDLALAVPALLLLLVPMAVIAIWVRATSQGPAIYWSERIGQGGKKFSMPKFRTMRIDTPVVATHLMDDPDTYLTDAGRFLRRTSLDELPQLWCIVRGYMSLVGPRPALFNQGDLIALRRQAGVDSLVPGLTGWAQINGRDELPIAEKVRLDGEYLARVSFLFDLKIIFLTFLRVIRGQGVSH
jgi:O-antigen biosynthesis protein WbqP